MTPNSLLGRRSAVLAAMLMCATMSVSEAASPWAEDYYNRAIAYYERDSHGLSVWAYASARAAGADQAPVEAAEAIIYRDVPSNYRPLAPTTLQHLAAALDLDMPVAKCGRSERAVLAGVRFVADSKITAIE